MPVSPEITMLSVEDDLRICPACGYEYGFHTSFLNINAEKDNPVKCTREVFRVIIICPECGARYDVGWRVSFAEPVSKVVKTTDLRQVGTDTPFKGGQ